MDAGDWLDDDGISDDPIRMEVTVTIDDGRFVVDFAGSAAGGARAGEHAVRRHDRMCKVVLKALTTPDRPSNARH